MLGESPESRKPDLAFQSLGYLCPLGLKRVWSVETLGKDGRWPAWGRDPRCVSVWHTGPAHWRCSIHVHGTNAACFILRIDFGAPGCSTEAVSDNTWENGRRNRIRGRSQAESCVSLQIHFENFKPPPRNHCQRDTETWCRAPVWNSPASPTDLFSATTIDKGWV